MNFAFFCMLSFTYEMHDMLLSGRYSLDLQDQEMERELNEMKSLFTMLDKDGNGRLSAEEVRTIDG